MQASCAKTESHSIGRSGCVRENERQGMMRKTTAAAALTAAMVLIGGCSPEPPGRAPEIPVPAKTTVKPITVLALGDSTTAGTPGFRSPVEAPPEGEGNSESQYAHWIRSKRPEWTVLNRGVNGERTDEIAARFQKDLTLFSPDVVIVLAGVNDLYQGRSADQILGELNKIYEMAEARKIRVMACTVLPYNTSTKPVRHQMMALNQRIRGAALNRNFLICDTYELLNDPVYPGKLIGTPDGLHPDVAGYRRMGEAMAAILEKEYAL